MKMNVFSIYDEKACVFANPFFMVQKGQALRAFQDLVSDVKSAVSKHPGDYKLYLLGIFDDEEGKIVCSAQPEYIACGNDFVDINLLKK